MRRLPLGRGVASDPLLAVVDALVALTPARRWWDLLRILLRLWEEWPNLGFGFAHWPVLRGGGWRVVRVCSQIGQYPPNNRWYTAQYSSNPFGASIHNWVESCLSGQSDSGQPKTLLASHNLAVESHRYPVTVGFKHRLVRSWARPTTAPAFSVQPAPVPFVPVLPLIQPAAVRLVRGVGGKVAPGRVEFFEPLPREMPLPARRPLAWPLEWGDEAIERQPPPVGFQPAPVVGPEPVDEVVVEPGGQPRVRKALAYARKPGRRQREKKVKLTKKGVQALFILARSGVNFVGEALDTLDALNDALPVNVRIWRNDPVAKVKALWEYWPYIDASRAIENLIVEAMKDRFYAWVSGRPWVHARVRPHVSIGYGAGPAL